MFDQLVGTVGAAVEHLGQEAASDATHLNARRRGQYDSPTARPDGGHKEYTDAQEAVSHVLEWYGDQLPVLCDARHEVALAYRQKASSVAVSAMVADFGHAGPSARRVGPPNPVPLNLQPLERNRLGRSSRLQCAYRPDSLGPEVGARNRPMGGESSPVRPIQPAHECRGTGSTPNRHGGCGRADLRRRVVPDQGEIGAARGLNFDPGTVSRRSAVPNAAGLRSFAPCAVPTITGHDVSGREVACRSGRHRAYLRAFGWRSRARRR